MEKFDFEKFRELDSLESMEYIVKYEKKTGRQFSEKEIYNLYNCEEEHFFFRERNIKDIMKMKFCRYITYVVKNEQSYVSAFVREFVMRKNEIVIFGITEEEKEGVPHLLFDVVSPTEMYTIFDYQRDLRRVIDENKGKDIILVGGSGLYIKAGLYDYKFALEENHKNFDEYSNEELLEMVKEKEVIIKQDKNFDKILVELR